jgi:hypothetical protein
LHWAAFYDHNDVVELLLANGADVNAKDNEGFTPLDWAIERNCRFVAKTLLSNGAKVKTKIISWDATLGPDPIHRAKLTSGSIKECYQNRDTLRDCYGDPVDARYHTLGNLIIAPSFTKKGILCKVDITANNGKLSDPEVSTILAGLAPKDARGKFIIDTFLSSICLEKNDAGKYEVFVCGGVSGAYDRITITKFGNTNEYTSVNLTYRHRNGCK